MLQLNFSSISESKPGHKWQTLFQKHWPAYKAWFVSKGVVYNPDLKTAQNQLQKHMPEWVGTYHQLCKLAGDDLVAARFLTGYQPPAYITGCSQAILKEEPILVRNYDYHPNLCEGTLLHSAWNGKQVIAVGDCLCGVVDGMNEDGLVASLTFGGRKEVGRGFGIPFILRYVLEFCTDVQDAVEVLHSIPSHMSYNVMLLDKSGKHKMLQLAPDRKTKVTDLPISTNHQGKIDWPEHARFSKTKEREQFLLKELQRPGCDDHALIRSFLEKPLFNRQYKDGFGTIYTSVYRPAEGNMELRWPGQRISQSINKFSEGERLISYSDQEVSDPISDPVSVPVVPSKEKVLEVSPAPASKQAQEWEDYGKSWATSDLSALALQVFKIIGESTGKAGSPEMEKIMAGLQSETKRRGQIPWELLADFWAQERDSYRS